MTMCLFLIAAGVLQLILLLIIRNQGGELPPEPPRSPSSSTTVDEALWTIGKTATRPWTKPDWLTWSRRMDELSIRYEKLRYDESAPVFSRDDLHLHEHDRSMVVIGVWFDGSDLAVRNDPSDDAVYIFDLDYNADVPIKFANSVDDFIIVVYEQYGGA